MNLNQFKYYYFIGIAGIGMSALARYFNKLDKIVLGYDKNNSRFSRKLESENISIIYADELGLIPDDLNQKNTLVTYTPAIPTNSKILNYFKTNDFTCLKRSEVLGQITSNTYCLAVAGTHGKTTTTSILGHLLKSAGKSVTAFIGGVTENYDSNLIFEGNEICVVEADEYDRSFLKLKPNIVGVTSIDADHLDIYGDVESLRDSFKNLIALANDLVITKKALNIENTLTYAIEDEADYYADNIRVKEGKYYFDFFSKALKIYDLPLEIPGKHNIENAVLAIAMALQCGLSKEEVLNGMKTYKGVKRRFSKFINQENKVIIDDYAHHPKQIDQTILAVKELYPSQKILGVFQPHLYSRTRDFANEFAKSLSELDELILLDIYPAREKPIPGITSKYLAEKIKTKVYLAQLDSVYKYIEDKSYDVLLLMGAGNIDTIYETLKTKEYEA